MVGWEPVMSRRTLLFIFGGQSLEITNYALIWLVWLSREIRPGVSSQS